MTISTHAIMGIGAFCFFLSGCGPEAPGPGPWNNGGGSAGGGQTSTDSSSSGVGTTTSTGVGTTNSGTGTPSASCVATCCDGSSKSGSETTAQDCKFYEGFACQDAGGPELITFKGATIWSAPAGCPSMGACVGNCCDGAMKVQGQQFDKDLCNFFAVSDGICDQDGGLAKVFFDGVETMNKVDWSNGQTSCGNCVATCCDGSVFAGNYPGAGDCNFWAGVPCNDRGGPEKIVYAGNVSWGPAGSCPSANECKLVCQNGATLVSQEYDQNMCVFFKVGGDFCKDKGGNAAVYYDGAKVWP